MKNLFSKLISLLLLLCIVISCLASCDSIFGGNGNGNTKPPHEHVDYVNQVKLDLDSTTAKIEVTVKMHIDGDTTHFRVPYSFDSNGYIKARYLAVNTPESTGKIEEWGKAASRFTEEKLLNAHSIIVESDNETWNFDSNGRYLVWVWYQPEEGAEYRNLNIELLQEGLAVGSKTADCRYDEIAVNAIAQATIEKLYVFSNNVDPEYPYGEAASVTLKELRTNTAAYAGQKVSVEGLVVYNSNYTVYLVSYDAENDMYFAMQVFYGYNSALHNVLAQGNMVRVVGIVNSFSGTWQISGLEYNAMRPTDPANTAKLSEGHEVTFKEIAPEQFHGNVTVSVDDEDRTYKFCQIAISSAVSVNNLYVSDVYTTTKGDSAGAMTLTCTANGTTIDVRTEVLKDASGNVITEEYFLNKTIDVQGLIEYFDLNNTGDGSYQIKVYTLGDITVH